MLDLKKSLPASLLALSCLGSGFLLPPLVQQSHAMYQNNPSVVTLEDVIACLIIFQNPGVELTPEQLALGINGVLGGNVDPNSFNPLPTTALCDFVNDGAGTSLSDVIATLVAFQNPGVTLTPEQLADGINGVLGGTLTGADINAVPPQLPGGGVVTTLELTLEGTGIDVDSGRPFVTPGGILKGTITASKSNGIEAGEITVSVVLNGTFDATPPRPLLTLSDVRLNNSDVNCPVGSTECTGNARVKISDLPEDLITRLQSGTLTVTVNGAGFGIRRTATASIDFRPSP
jgi:hypothetical protein